MRGFITFIGRLCLAAIFGWAANDYVRHWPDRVQQLVEQTGGPNVLGHALLGGATAFLVLGVLALVLGLFARWGALLLMIFLIPTTILFHDFWNIPNQDEFKMQLIQFLKNLGLFGGLAVLVELGPGPWAFDRLRQKRKAADAAETQTTPETEQAR